MFPGTKAFQKGNLEPPSTNGIKSDEKKRKRAGGDGDDEDEKAKKIKSEDMSAEESAGDENSPKKFNWELTVRHLLVTIN